ncbi:hypothetical protein [uncultured Psychrobacter sp.]|uniref:hypothetical protein n=1 Tax=uncultured Psychrobacter sp. TaxID=259303 RepID=UPI0034588717
MTQPFASDDRLSGADRTGPVKLIEGSAERSSHLPDSAQPAIVHPNFDPSQTPLDPARPLNDIPEPARRSNSQLRRLYGKSSRFYQPKEDTLSKWQLVASESFAEHLSLLSAAKLIAVSESFYRPHSSSSQNKQALLSPLEQMTLVDIADIQAVINQYPKLTRYGFNIPKEMDLVNHQAYDKKAGDKQPATMRTLLKRHNPDELLNSLYADDWQVILQPEQFDTGVGSLATDIMACSVAIHALKQCATRQSINNSYSAEQICQHVRSYLLSQVSLLPAQRYQYRQIRLFSGHIIVAAAYLGWDIQVRDNVHGDCDCYFNVSSRCSLLTRYANLQDYYINGWSG